MTSILMVITFCYSCSLQNKFLPIHVEKKECLYGCQAYSVRISNDKKLEFEGKKNTVLIGKFSVVLSKSEHMSLLAQYEKIDYSKKNTSEERYIYDLQVTEIRDNRNFYSFQKKDIDNMEVAKFIVLLEEILKNKKVIN
ncbi:DUF6438 domain-containing protein [Tenacibaculum sp. MAR_2009_124]|uniref:DUF6438 domain-containing protein n=1 Tax=Tenacibaculum sp. MAR_2009_124 TaxID=1250059 RepID=UPI00115FE487|nr:DUF6438 domain-containing protein [Tenacibaculum sp. MAR_2009_124]